MLAALALVALPALAEPGFFDAVRGQDKVLRKSQCTARQVLVCEIRCPGTALADGMPARRRATCPSAGARMGRSTGRRSRS
jgi:hypothetical protein